MKQIAEFWKVQGLLRPILVVPTGKNPREDE